VETRTGKIIYFFSIVDNNFNKIRGTLVYPH